MTRPRPKKPKEKWNCWCGYDHRPEDHASIFGDERTDEFDADDYEYPEVGFDEQF